MTEIYVAHEIIFNKNFNRYAFYHNELSGCNFNNQYLVSKEVVLLTVDKDKNLCYLDTLAPCNLINANNLRKSITLFECRYCSKCSPDKKECEQIATMKSGILGVINVMPISEFTKIGYIPLSISLIKEYNSSVKDEYEIIDDKSYSDKITRINSGFAKIRAKKEN